MEAGAEDREALVQVIHQSENVSSNHEEPKQDSFRKYYTLPGVRYCTVFKAILFIDAIFSLVLWLTGGNSEYFIDSIVNFHLKESAFDLAVLNAAKVIIAFAVIDTMEETSLQLVDDPYNAKLIRKKLLAHIGLIVMLLLTFSYAVVKGGLILYALLNDTSYTKMHLTFNILTISAVVFGAVELITALTSFWAMKRLQVIRILHRVNESGEEVDEEGKKVKKKATLIRLIKLARPEAGIITWASLCLLVSAATQTVAPLFFGIVVDAASRSMEELNQTVLILLGIYMGGAIFSMFRAWLFTLAGQRFVARLRKELFSNIIKQDVAFFDTTRTGELTNRLASDTQVLQNAVTVNVSMLARYVLTIIGSLAFMFVLNSALTGVLLAVVPVVSIGAVQYGKFVMGIRKAFQDRLADASTTAEEAISSVRTVRSFTGEAKATAAYGKDIDKSYDQGKKLAIASGGFDGLIGMVANGAVLLVMWYGGKLIYEKQITAGQLTSFLVYTFQVAMAFAFVSSLYGDFMQAVGASVRIFDLLDQKPGIPLDQGISSEDALQGSLEFYNVKFTYPSRSDTQVLKGVTFSVSSGQMIALVGPSGGGKSTIVSLIERFYDPDSGYICLGGFELKSLSPLWFRSKVAIVSQEPTLFACSIRDNIAYGKDATEEQIIEAAKQANAHNFIMTFEEGYRTLVGERGVRLSGGQKQRVAIARALIMNPVVLLLDEATSALDAESEHLVQEAIDRAMLNRTVVVVAHRLSTVRNASKVLVVDKGQIVESGTHDELLAKKGVYKKLVYRQLMAGGQEEEGGSVEDSKETSQQGKEGDHSQEVLVHVSGHNAEAATGDMTSHQVVNGDDEQLINIE